MDRKLLNYLPPVLRGVREFQVINEATEPETIKAWNAINQVLANQFLEDADEAGVAIWERELQLYPRDTDTLEARKVRIKAKWNLKLPYTVPWLRNWLAGLCGPAGYDLTVMDHTVSIQLDYGALPDANTMASEILDMLLTVKPSNMRVLMAACLQSWGTSVMAGPLEHHAILEIFPNGQEE